MRILKWTLGLFCLFVTGSAMAQDSFTIEQLLSAPFPADLTASKSGNRIAWTFYEQGQRNIYAAEAPNFAAHRVTSYLEDDGQELTQLSFSPDGNTIVYVRGGGKNASGQFPNPTSNPAGAEEEVWSVPFAGGAPKKIDAGTSPKVSSTNWVAHVRDGQIYLAPLSANAKPDHLVVRGGNFSPVWSPSGNQLAFVSSRGDHSFIGVYDVAGKSVKFLSPTVDSDSNPQWSPDGKRIAFVRQPAVKRDTPDGYFIEPDRPHPWSIWLADASSGSAKQIWHSGNTPNDSFPYMSDESAGFLHWSSNDTIVFSSEQDGWQHLYSLAAAGGTAKLLTPGNCEVEQWSLTPDGKSALFNSNCTDIDLRHLSSVDVASGQMQNLTSGKGIEWSAVPLNSSGSYAYLASSVQDAARVFVHVSGSGADKLLAAETWPKNFPSGKLVTPQQVIFKSPDNLDIHGQLFLPKNLKAGDKRPAVIFMHGGPMRQMLLGWHYMFYYANCYAMNQYLASRGYVVLSVNYRSGIGYGRAFREAPGRAGRGASEYQDIVAAGKYLQSRADVDPARVGLWGGSYGGYLTALGLGRNSDIFAAGVDIHGVHDWPTDNWDGKNIPPDLIKLAHDSSPVTAVDTWRSPVLFIHGDDDRNVYFSQTVDLVARLRDKNISIEQMVFPDEIHDFLLYKNWTAAYHAASDFFDRKIGVASGSR